MDASPLHQPRMTTPDTADGWSENTILSLLDQPLLDLLWRAQQVHRAHHDPHAVQRATLLSVKTGGCPEDCGYCPQSAHYDTGLGRQGLLPVDDVVAAARRAKAAGASRFCLGAAWRSAKPGKDFDQVLAMVRGVAAEGMEVCATLGMLGDGQAEALAEAGLHAYNHNLDTSRSHYGAIISTRNYDDRLDTLHKVSAAGLKVCCGGIVGMGETRRDRAALLAQLAQLDPPPESVPINQLVQVAGTPLHGSEPLDPMELVRMVAAARIVLPTARVRLSAGRTALSKEAQTLCFLAGANSIFFGDKLLTTSNPSEDADAALLAELGLTTQPC
jgi:biotin synthase